MANPVDKLSVKQAFGWLFGKLKDTFVPFVLPNGKVIYGTKPDGTEVQAFNPQNTNGNTIVGYGNYEGKSGNTNLYGNDVAIGVANIATPGTFRPYYRKGDVISVRLITAGYATSSGAEVLFCVPLMKPIVGNPTISASSVDGFVLRQGGNYTHGTTSTTYKKPSKYEINLVSESMIHVIATFTTTTDSINNDTIGIHWSGKITLS